MKHNNMKLTIKTALLVLAASFFFSSCKDEPKSSDPQPTKNMLEILADAKFSIFKTAVDKANLSTTFSGSTKYTLFVPTDDVMVAAGLPNVDGLSESQCANLVRYHMLEGVQTATTLPAFGFVTTLNNEGPVGFKLKMNVAVATGVIRVNNAQVVASNVATNGAVHEITKLLKQPTMYEMISYTGDLSKYKTGLDYETNLKDLLKDPTGLTTIFATNNAGTVAYLNLKNRDFSSLPPADRRAFLNNGFVKDANKLAAGLTSGSLTTLGEPINFSSVAGIVTLNDSIAVTYSDIQCVNGVIHIIDKSLAK
jgi:uncharacterized surface protein with fasciclin (FAS1) repeats